MLPFIDYKSLTGYFIDYIGGGNYNIYDDRIYAAAYITLSSNHVETTRNFGKLDDALSYVGGLFGIIIAFLAFFMMSFN